MAAEALKKLTVVKKWIYGYTLDHPKYAGLIKVGETTREVGERIREQVAAIKMPYEVHKLLWQGSAMRPDGTSFSDKDIHRALEVMKVKAVGGEWYRCSVEELQAAYVAVFERLANVEKRTENFTMREEQREAVERTVAYFKKERVADATRAPKFLWNAKMRFGKTFATYQLAKRMGFKRVLILTFKPAVMSAWEEDLKRHVDFEGWSFIRRYDGAGMPSMDVQYAQADKAMPMVCFGSFQDFLGVDKASGGIKASHTWVREINWDMVVFDEYHFGSWRERAQQLFALEDEDVYEDTKRDLDSEVRGNNLNEESLPITTNHYLFLSGTPFRMLTSGEFIEEQVYSWTYTDEQRRKAEWERRDREHNPYSALPRMKLLTYQLPESIRRIAEQGDKNEFDLNVFFSTTGDKWESTFVYETEVGCWLDFIRGHYFPQVESALTSGVKPPLPYADINLLSVLSHTLWFLPDVASCRAMEALLKKHLFFKNYKVICCAGVEAGCGVEALEPVLKAMENPLETRTITLSCGKLTTGVTVRPWGGILMLRNLKSPETYFQAAFRVQSPWTTKDDEGRTVVIKEDCYVLDFAPNRALRQVAEYSEKLTINETTQSNPETRVNEFIHFLPILYYNGVAMRKIDANEVLDIALSGTSATLLARRWESALLVNVDNDTLKRLIANEKAMEVISKIEGFRNLNNKTDLEILVNETEAIKAAKREGANNEEKKTKTELTGEEKKYKKERKAIQEKLIKFATRIPIFMYLTDDREHTLKEVIRQVETALFERVTGITLRDFDLLVSLGLFSERLMNSAVLNFKRYEDASLSYSGINRHEGERYIGAWDTSIEK